jgi:uncharacterized protein with von Willebrand factor type A (vWA) domain
MFVRWKRRKRSFTRGWANQFGSGESYGAWQAKQDGDSLDAVVVQSVRVDSNIRQKFVCHLASISENYIGKESVLPRAEFWQKVTSKLATLSLGDPERRTIEAAIDKVVPRPADEQVAQQNAEWEALMKPLRAMFPKKQTRRRRRRSAENRATVIQN